jgi:hypothetical protein
VPFGSPFSEAEKLTALFQRESREKPQLHDFGSLRFFLRIVAREA